MVLFPNAKVNLGLYITEKRKDGFHNLETCFYPIGWKDILEITPAKKTEIVVSGIKIPGNPKENICYQAWKLLNKEFGIPNVRIHLHKLIPTGAGLGGGSSDAAFAIKQLCKEFNLIYEEDLMEFYASQIGSDCAFFINNKAALGRGKGDELEQIDLDLSGKYMIVVHPGIHVSTAEAYSLIVPKPPKFKLEDILKTPIAEWKDTLHNDFEVSVFKKFPEIAKIKDELYAAGAEYACMSGSGSAVFGIFKEETNFSIKEQYKFWKGYL